MTKLFITQHLGLGDAIICQSIIKLYSQKYDEIIIPIDFRFKQSISKIYQNYKNVTLLELSHTNGYSQIKSIAETQYKNNSLLIGLFSPAYFYIVNKFKTLNSTFYIPAKVKLEKQWEIPVITRNLERELELFKMYHVKQRQYVLIIQDSKRLNEQRRPMTIKREFIDNTDISIVKFQVKTNNIFDNCYLLQNAREIHTYDTSITHVLDQCCTLNGDIKVFNHKYIRPQQKRVVNQYKHSFNDIW